MQKRKEGRRQGRDTPGGKALPRIMSVRKNDERMMLGGRNF